MTTPAAAARDADEATARLLQRSRVHGAASLVAAPTATASAMLRQQPNQQTSLARRLLAVTDARTLLRECEATEKLVHLKETGAYSPQLLTLHGYPSDSVGLDAIDTLRDELCELQALECLSLQEEEYALELTSTIVDTISRAYLAGTFGDNDPRQPTRADGPDDARLWLLQLAVQPSSVSRQLAFTILFQVGVSATSILLTTAATSSRSTLRDIVRLEDELFATLREMLAKAVVVAGTASASPTRRQARGAAQGLERAELRWVEAATDCLALFVKQPDTNGGFRRDRLSQLNPGVIRYVVETVAMSPPQDSHVQEHVVELMIATVYTSEPRMGSTPTSLSPPVPKSGPRISPVAFEQCCSLELLLAMLYTTASKRVQQLLFMAVFDLACEQLHRSKTAAAPVCKDPDLLWLALLEQEFSSQWLRSPLTFSSPLIPRIAKTLATAHLSLFDKSTLAVLMQLHRFLHIDDYFERSVGLSNAIRVAKSQEKRRLADTVMRKLDELLASSSKAEKFRGELWLAELLAFGVDTSTDGNGSRDAILKPMGEHGGEKLAGEEVSEAGRFDENGDIRCAAQTRLWDLVAASSSTAERFSFARVVTLFIRRLRRTKEANEAAVTELRTCLDVVVKQNESNKEEISVLMLLVLDVCQSAETTHADRRRLAFDQSAGEQPKSVDGVATTPDITTHDDQDGKSDSTAFRILNGSASLDMDLLAALGPDFFLHAATVLTVHQLPSEHCCRGVCCSSTRSITSDAGVCAAVILFHLCESSDAALSRVGGLGSALMFLRSCETRVAVLAARFLHRQIKRDNPTRYYALLRDLSATCADRDDGDTLSNSLLHVQTMLQSGISIETGGN